MGADRILPLDDHDARRRVCPQQLSGYGQADDPGADDGQPSHLPKPRAW
jgi:hypothetical protein